MFKIEFDTLNAGIQTAEEISRILKHVGQYLSNGETEGRIRDNNGNTIGSWEWTAPELPGDVNKAEALALILENDSSFYFSQAKKLIMEHSERILEENFCSKRAKQEWFSEIIKALRGNPKIKIFTGTLDTATKYLCADILMNKYSEEISDLVEEKKLEVNSHE